MAKRGILSALSADNTKSEGQVLFADDELDIAVITAKGKDLNELLLSVGLARIYGTRTPLPDGRDSREYLAHLRELESEAKAAKRGAWGKVSQ